MIRERTALEKRNKSMEESYYIYRTTWAEDWPQFCELTFFRDLFRERIQNKFEIFYLFYPLVGIAISFIISIAAAIISKNFFIGMIVFAALVVIVVLVYSIYFSVLTHRVNKLNGLIGHFYTKYGRKTMKALYQKYRPDELPPQPERYYNLNEEDEIAEGGNTDDAETEEKEEPTADAATDGIDLRLVKRGGSSDNVSDSGDVITNNNNIPETEKDEEGDSSGKSEQTLSEEADEADSNAETYVEAVTVIDAELPTSTADDTDLSVQETYEDIRDEDVPNDFFVTDESETEKIFGEDDQDKVPENSELTLADIFDDFSDEDYREESEEDIIVEETEETDEELAKEDTVDENVETAGPETIDEETVEEEYDAEAEEETEELTENEEGGEENSRLFPEGYNPTIAELRAALRALSSYN